MADKPRKLGGIRSTLQQFFAEREASTPPEPTEFEREQAERKANPRYMQGDKLDVLMVQKKLGADDLAAKLKAGGVENISADDIRDFRANKKAMEPEQTHAIASENGLNLSGDEEGALSKAAAALKGVLAKAPDVEHGNAGGPNQTLMRDATQAALNDPDSDLAKAKQKSDAARKELRQARKALGKFIETRRKQISPKSGEKGRIVLDWGNHTRHDCLSMEALAKRLNEAGLQIDEKPVNVGHIVEIESGKRPMPMDSQAYFAKALELNIDDRAKLGSLQHEEICCAARAGALGLASFAMSIWNNNDHGAAKG